MEPGPVLSARGIRKSFGSVRALKGVDFDAYAGHVVALIGDNGAGKSTLVKVLAGVHTPDEGDILLDGHPVSIRTPRDARAMGIETVYQDLSLAPELDPIANLFLGRESLRSGVLGRLGFIDSDAMRRKGDGVLQELGVRLPDTRSWVASMSGGQRQGIAVCRAVMWASRVIFLDEPTAALGTVQTRNVHDLIRRVRDRGVAVVVISHNMPEVLEIADRIEVLRLGRRVARFSRQEATMESLVATMTGAMTQDLEALGREVAW